MPIYLIAGPPCAGKSTLVRRLAGERDVVLDFDQVCAELDGQPGWTHSKAVREHAGRVMDQRIARLRRYSGTAYLIRSAPEAVERMSLARQLNAEVWLLNPGMRECMRRARVDGRPTRTFQAIADWYDTYHPAVMDQRPPRAA